ncbi:C-type lectin domain family 4 member D-like [Cygnus atratus]|uniref:C-type lectin domain family 4 member D-like n=1 Tax=Cygnus atratus TaxID=8868 RepID=UPI0015D58DAA|nr:C-type lectin domain family 4 member D-like [Cygnus atratus]
MESEITYAEVKFKNASPTEEVEVPQKKKKHEQHTQTYPPWLPWLISLLLLLVCAALVVALLVTHISYSCDEPTALQLNLTEWHCILSVPQGKGRGWKCCPEGWRRFQDSCYYFSADRMPWDESQQNCSGMGSHLVVINTKAEQDFLNKEITRQNTYRREGINLHIGLRAQEVGQWHWADQTPYNETATFWRSGEPSNAPDETCVVIHHNTEHLRNWNDVPCKTYSYRICETAAVTI